MLFNKVTSTVIMETTNFKQKIGARAHLLLPPLWFGGLALGQMLSSETLLKGTVFLPIRCPLHLLTGILCPTCGLGRSLVLAFTGFYAESLSFHPGGLFVLLFSILYFFWRLGYLPKIQSDFLRLFGLKTTAVFIVLYSVWGFARNFSNY